MDKAKLFGIKLKEEKVTIEEQVIIVKELTAGQASEYQNSMFEIVNGKPIPKTKDLDVKLVILTCYDEDNNKLFDIKELEQVKSLPSSVIEKLYTVAHRINNPKKENVLKN